MKSCDAASAEIQSPDLGASEERYRTLLNSIDVGFCVIEILFDDNRNAVDLRFLETNPAFEKQSGLSDVVGKRVRTLVPQLEAHWFETYGHGLVISSKCNNWKSRVKMRNCAWRYNTSSAALRKSAPPPSQGAPAHD